MLSQLRTRYFQFLEHSRQQGFLSACRISCYKYEEMVPTEKDLTSLRPVRAPSGGPLPLVEIGPENFQSVRLRFPVRSRRERMPHYFRRGYRLLAMVRDGEVIGDVWYVTRKTARSSTIHPHLQWFGIELADDEIYMFDLQVNPDQRGGGLTAYFLGSVLQRMREKGMHKAYGCFVAHNTPALWMHRMAGYRELPRWIVRRFIFHETVRAKE